MRLSSFSIILDLPAVSLKAYTFSLVDEFTREYKKVCQSSDISDQSSSTLGGSKSYQLSYCNNNPALEASAGL